MCSVPVSFHIVMPSTGSSTYVIFVRWFRLSMILHRSKPHRVFEKHCQTKLKMYICDALARTTAFAFGHKRPAGNRHLVYQPEIDRRASYGTINRRLLRAYVSRSIEPVTWSQQGVRRCVILGQKLVEQRGRHYCLCPSSRAHVSLRMTETTQASPKNRLSQQHPRETVNRPLFFSVTR